MQRLLPGHSFCFVAYSVLAVRAEYAPICLAMQRGYAGSVELRQTASMVCGLHERPRTKDRCLSHHATAVDRQDHAGDECGFVGSEIDGRAGDIVRQSGTGDCLQFRQDRLYALSG